MADYYTSQQLVQMAGVAEAAVTELQTKGLLQPTLKDGRTFFSAGQVHCLRAAVRWARKDQIDLSVAFARAEERWLAHTNAPKD